MCPCKLDPNSFGDCHRNWDYIICLEDGKKFRTIKRHLRTEHEMSPEQYRQKWGLAPDYPIVASEYTDRRSAMAKKAGLGQRKRKK